MEELFDLLQTISKDKMDLFRNRAFENLVANFDKPVLPGPNSILDKKELAGTM